MKVLTILVSIVALAASSAVSLGQQSTAYQINRAHSGESIWATPPTFPMLEKWNVTLPNSVSYPIIADGRVFALSATIQGGQGAMLYAFDSTNGRRLWQRPVQGQHFWAAMTYGQNQLYVINFNGRLSAIDAATGALLWKQDLFDQYAFSSAPTYSNGIVYLCGSGNSGTLYAVDGTTGTVLWRSSVRNGDQSSPTVTDNAVYVSFAGNQAYRFNAKSGRLVWHHDSDRSGGGGRTTMLNRYGLHIRDFEDLVLDSQTGGTLFSFESETIPASSDKLRFDMSAGTLTCFNEATQTKVWSFEGDGTLQSAPIVVNGFVIAGGQSGNLYFLKKFTGQVAWTANVGSAIDAPDENNINRPLTGFGAGEGLIVIPAGNHLIAYSN